MTEQEFWSFFKKSCKDGKGRQDNGRISEEDMLKIGSLLFKKDVKHKTREAIIMTLAHQPSEVALTILTKYNIRPDVGLELFSKFALEECAWWND